MCMHTYTCTLDESVKSTYVLTYITYSKYIVHIIDSLHYSDYMYSYDANIRKDKIQRCKYVHSYTYGTQKLPFVEAFAEGSEGLITEFLIGSG